MSASFHGHLSFPLNDAVTLRRGTIRPAVIYALNQGSPASQATLFISLFNLGDEEVICELAKYSEIPKLYTTFAHDTSGTSKVISPKGVYSNGSPTALEHEPGETTITVQPKGRLDLSFDASGTPYVGIKNVTAATTGGQLSVQLQSNRDISIVHTDREWFNVYAQTVAGTSHSLNDVALISASATVVAELREGWERGYYFRRDTGEATVTDVTIASGTASAFSFDVTSQSVKIKNPSSDIVLEVTLSS